MNRTVTLFLASTIFFAPFHSWAKKAKLPIIIPQEYVVLERAKKAFLAEKLGISQIETHQRELKKLKWIGSNKALERDAEDLYWSFEIHRAGIISRSNKKAGLDFWIKALNSLHAHKWIYAWNENTSADLAKICAQPRAKKISAVSRDKVLSKKEIELNEKCFYVAGKVLNAFPKLAVETEVLRKEIPDAIPQIEAPEKYERLSQTYSEKIEKDEVAFAPLLDHYLNQRDSDLFKESKDFLENFPRSVLRTRVAFLVAERKFAKGDTKDAEPLYQSIIDESPFGYYAIVSSERLGVSLRDQIKKVEPQTEVLLDDFKPNFIEESALSRVDHLVRGKKHEAVSIELEQFSRPRVYPTQFLMSLIHFANQAEQDLSGFRLATEIIQRKGEVPRTSEFVEYIFPDRYKKEIEAEAKKNGVEPLWILSLMKQESGFKSGILSSSGAMGLMQLMPFTAIDVQRDLKLRTLRDPAKNIEIGTRYLASLLNEKFNGNIVYSLAGYNAGPHRVAKWQKDAKPDWGMQEFIEAIPYKETRDYVMSIIRNRYWYQYRRGIPAQSVFELWNAKKS